MTHHWGYVGAFTAAILFGISATLNKVVLSEVNPTVAAGSIYIIAGLVLFAVRFSPFNKKILSLLETPTETEKNIQKKDYIILSLVIISGSFIAPFLFMHGLNQTSAVNTSLLINTESLFTASLAFVFLKERALKKDYLGIFLIMLGALFVTTSGEFYKLEFSKGILGSILVISACLFWSIDNNLSKFLSKKQDLLLITSLKCSFGGIILLLLAISLGFNINLQIHLLLYLFTVGAFSIGFSILLFIFALREIGAMKTSVIYSSSSLIGAFFAFLILNEPISIVQITSGLVMFIGIYILYKQ